MFLSILFQSLLSLAALIALIHTITHPHPTSILESKLYNADCTYEMDQPDYFHQPSSKSELMQILGRIGKAQDRVRVVGGHHSWSRATAALSHDAAHHLGKKTHLISLDRYNKILDLYEKNGTVRVQAGIRLYQLQKGLGMRGWTLEQLGSITLQSIAGAISTGTHGSGITLGNLASFVEEIELMSIGATGAVQVRELSKHDANPDIFNAAVVSLGALGVISEVRIRVVPLQYAEKVEQRIAFEKLTTDANLQQKLLTDNKYVKIWHFASTGQSCIIHQNPLPLDQSLWTAEQRAALEWRQSLVGKLWFWLDAKLIRSYVVNSLLWFSRVVLPPNILKQFMSNMFVFGCSEFTTVDTLEKSLNVESDVIRHVESEFVVPMQFWPRVFRALFDLEKKYVINFISEIRFVKGDEFLLSPSFGKEPRAYFTLLIAGLPHWKEYFADCHDTIQKIAKEHGFDVRTHWGKYQVDADRGLLHEHAVRAWPRFKDFARIRRELDPLDIFLNDYLMMLFKEER